MIRINLLPAREASRAACLRQQLQVTRSPCWRLSVLACGLTAQNTERGASARAAVVEEESNALRRS